MTQVATSPDVICAVVHFGGMDGKVHGVLSAVLPIAAARATDGAVIIATTTAA
jgi:exonuclease I